MKTKGPPIRKRGPTHLLLLGEKAGMRENFIRAALILFAVLLCAPRAQAYVTNVQALVTFTNQIASRGATTNGDTITVNGDVRRYTNGTLASASSWIQSTNVLGHAATNTWLHLGTYGVTGVERVFPTNTASIVIVGSFRTNTFLSVTLSSGVGTVSYATNVWAESYPLMHPTDSLATEAARTNNESGFFAVMSDAGSRSTNTVPNRVPALTNLLDRISHQSFTNKTAYGLTNRGGFSDGVVLTNVVAIWGSNGALFGVVITGATNLSGYAGSLTNGTFYSNTLHFVRGTNLQALHGTVHILSNGLYSAPTLTNPVTLNLINYGNAIRSEGPGGNSFQMGSNSWALGARSIAIGNGAFTTNTEAVAVGTAAIATNDNSTAIGSGARAAAASASAFGDDAVASGAFSLAVGQAATASGESDLAIGVTAAASGSYGVAVGTEAIASARSAVAVGEAAGASAIYSGAFGPQVSAAHSNSVAIGTIAFSGAATSTTTTNQIRIATTEHVVSAPGFIQAAGISNLVTVAGQTNVMGGDLSTPRAAVTTIANGANRFSMGTNIFIDLVGSPSAGGWSVDGIIFGTVVPRDGHQIFVRNGTGYDATFAHNSGLEAVAAYRISTATSTNVIFTNAATAHLIYSASSARWLLWNVFSGHAVLASATNAMGFLDGSGTNASFYQTAGKATATFNALVGIATNIQQSVATNGALAAGVNSNGTLFARNVPGSTKNAFEVLTTNGAAHTYSRSNGTFVATNFAQTPFIADAGASEQRVSYRLYALEVTTPVTVTNTTSPTSLVTNATRGSMKIKGGTVTSNTTIRVSAAGYITSASATACEVGIRFNNGLVIATNMAALPTTLVNDGWVLNCEIGVGALGASGSALGAGTFAWPASAGASVTMGGRRICYGLFPTLQTVDWDSDQVVDIYIDPGATTHGVTCTRALVEIIP